MSLELQVLEPEALKLQVLLFQGPLTIYKDKNNNNRQCNRFTVVLISSTNEISTCSTLHINIVSNDIVS